MRAQAPTEWTPPAASMEAVNPWESMVPAVAASASPMTANRRRSGRELVRQRGEEARRAEPLMPERLGPRTLSAEQGRQLSLESGIPRLMAQSRSRERLQRAR